MGIEFLPGFYAETLYGQVIHVLGQQMVFLPAEGLNLALLLFDIAGVAKGDIHLVTHGRGKGRPLGVDSLQVVISDARPAQKVCQIDGAGALRLAQSGQGLIQRGGFGDKRCSRFR